MIWLLCLVTLPVLWMLGRGLWLLMEPKAPDKLNTFPDSIMTGLIFVIGLTEVVHLFMVLMHASLTNGAMLFLIGIAAGLLLSFLILVIGRKNLRRPSLKFPKLGAASWVVLVVFVLLVLGQAAFVLFSGRVYWDRDLTVETVNTFLQDNGAHMTDPLTGAAYELGMPMRVKILCLPTLYAVLGSLCHLSAVQVVLTFAPLMVIFASYCAFAALGRTLFEDSFLKRIGFLACCAFLLWMGSYLYGMEGFGLLYCGWRGTSIRALVLFPYALSLILRKKWLPLFLCFLAEACIVWTLYGMGLCFLASVGMAVTFVIVGYLNVNEGTPENGRNAGKGAK